MEQCIKASIWAMRKVIKKTSWIVLLLIITLFIAACTGTVKDKPQGTVKNDTVATETNKVNPSTNTVVEGSIKPYKEVDSLVKETKQQYKVADILKLDSICVKSDGDLSEKYYEVSKGLFSNHLTEFVKYISEHPNSCLKAKLIEGISADLSVYEGNERSEQIAKEKARTLTKAKREKLSIAQLQVIEAIYKNVNPALFD